MLPPWGLLPGDLNRIHEERRQRLKADWSSDLGIGIPVFRLARAFAAQAALLAERLVHVQTRANAGRTVVEPEGVQQFHRPSIADRWTLPPAA
jgi:hypothetical protein